jgi:translation initiation factor IF-3
LVERFLTEGHKVKITIMFRGRESAHPELGARILDRIVEKLTDIAKIESAPKLDGRNMIMVLGPDKKSKPKVDEGAKAVAKPVVAAVATVAAPQEIVQQEVVPSVSAEATQEEG